ncbi:ribulose-phosphate 3-epimerase, cytoplasmic isoform-like [Papaver somniferum]|uniref:ribulose-phosphate 3-epimerase, cytoplasmic isoform-like n=1 Tax=Papaver somniferum TaxID=3469 RepID=UPI000E70589B|nr:ribulose-phosphate 3-epimerase, cytoplasmic isoform-like [Papaver somniferum]
MLDKVHTLRKKYPKLDIQVDGSVGICNIKVVTAAGANCIVSGAAMFTITDKPREFLACYKTLAEKGIERLNWFAENAARGN